MKKKQVIISGIVILVIALICLGVFFLYQRIEQTKRQQEEEMNNLKNTYELFKEDANNFNRVKEEFDQKLSTIYYNTLASENPSILEQIEVYKQSKNNLIEIGNTLKDGCDKYSSNLTRICSSYEKSVTSAINVYESDIKRYNDLVKEYNNWVLENPEYESIKEFQE